MYGKRALVGRKEKIKDGMTWEPRKIQERLRRIAKTERRIEKMWYWRTGRF